MQLFHSSSAHLGILTLRHFLSRELEQHRDRLIREMTRHTPWRKDAIIVERNTNQTGQHGGESLTRREHGRWTLPSSPGMDPGGCGRDLPVEPCRHQHSSCKELLPRFPGGALHSFTEEQSVKCWGETHSHGVRCNDGNRAEAQVSRERRRFYRGKNRTFSITPFDLMVIIYKLYPL